MQHRDKTSWNRIGQIWGNSGFPYVCQVTVLWDFAEFQTLLIYLDILLNDLILLIKFNNRQLGPNHVPHDIFQDFDLHFIVGLLAAPKSEIGKNVLELGLFALVLGVELLLLVVFLKVVRKCRLVCYG